MSSPRPKGNYGIDAPWVPWMWVGFAVIYLGLAAFSDPGVMTVVLVVLALVFLAAAGLYWYTSLRGKFEVWNELLAALGPPSRMLDLGCGRGAVSIMAATRFPDLVVDGVDLWRSIDQSGNSPQASAANAEANGVADRVRFSTGNMMELPFPDAGFDLVTASLSIHNIKSAQGRATAIDEAWRVLQPGGRLVILDISKTHEYERRLAELGAADLTSRDAGWRVWWSGPWMASRIVTAGKPA